MIYGYFVMKLVSTPQLNLLHFMSHTLKVDLINLQFFVIYNPLLQISFYGAR